MHLNPFRRGNADEGNPRATGKGNPTSTAEHLTQADEEDPHEIALLAGLNTARANAVATVPPKASAPLRVFGSEGDTLPTQVELAQAEHLVQKMAGVTKADASKLPVLFEEAKRRCKLTIGMGEPGTAKVQTVIIRQRAALMVEIARSVLDLWRLIRDLCAKNPATTELDKVKLVLHVAIKAIKQPGSPPDSDFDLGTLPEQPQPETH